MFQDIWNGTFHELTGLPFLAYRTTCLRTIWNGTISRQHRMEQYMNSKDFLFQDSKEWNSSWIRRTPCFRTAWNRIVHALEGLTVSGQHGMEQFKN